MFLKYLTNIALKLIKLAIMVYSAIISPFLPKACRYHPSCSEYCIEAVNKFGFKGVFLGFVRILKCNPFFPGGYDPVTSSIKNYKSIENPHLLIKEKLSLTEKHKIYTK